MHRHFYSPVRFGAGMGFLIGLLSIPVFINIGVYDLLSYDVLLTLLWCLLVPLISALGLWVALLLPLPRVLTHQFIRYGMVGVFNTLLNLALFNSLLYYFQVTSGPLIPVFTTLVGVVVITAAFFLNKYFVFDSHDTPHTKKEYLRFIVVSTTVTIVDICIVSFLINGVGAPAGISGAVWANIAVLVTIPVSVLGNFFGYKFLVFAHI